MTPDQHAEWLTFRVKAARSHIPPMFAAAALGLPTVQAWCEQLIDRKSTRLNSSHLRLSRMPSSA